MKAAKARDIAEIERDADHAEQHEIGDADGACDHDRRIGRAYFLVGDGQRRLRQPAAPFDRRAVHCGEGCGGSRGIQHRACVDRFHCFQIRSCTGI